MSSTTIEELGNTFLAQKYPDGYKDFLKYNYPDKYKEIFPHKENTSESKILIQPSSDNPFSSQVTKKVSINPKSKKEIERERERTKIMELERKKIIKRNQEKYNERIRQKLKTLDETTPKYNKQTDSYKELKFKKDIGKIKQKFILYLQSLAMYNSANCDKITSKKVDDYNFNICQRIYNTLLENYNELDESLIPDISLYRGDKKIEHPYNPIYAGKKIKKITKKNINNKKNTKKKYKKI